MNAYAMSKRHSCSLCDKSFSRKYDLGRHEVNDHYPDKIEYENNSSSEDDLEIDNGIEMTEESDLSDEVDIGSDEEENESEMSTDDLEDNPTYLEWYQQALDNTEEMRDQKFEKYIAEGMDEDEAREKAHEKLLWSIKKHFFDSLTNFMSDYLRLKDDETFQLMLNDIEEKLEEKGKDTDVTLRRVIRRFKSKFDGLFEEGEDIDNEEEELSDED